MTKEEYVTQVSAWLKRGVQVGDVLVTGNDDPAIIRLCRHTNRKHVVICFDSWITPERLVNGPRHVMITFQGYRGPALKGYLVNQEHDTPINSVEVTSVYPNSVYCKVLH